MLQGADNNPSISARSKNSTVRRTQRLPEIAKILWQRSMGVVSFFRTPSQSAMYALRCLLEVPGATLGQHTEKQTQALQRVPQTHSRFLPMPWYYLLQGSSEVRTPGSSTSLTSEYNRPTTSAAGFLPCCCSFPLFPPLSKSPLEVSDVRPNSQSSSVRVERRVVLR